MTYHLVRHVVKIGLNLAAYRPRSIASIDLIPPSASCQVNESSTFLLTPMKSNSATLAFLYTPTLPYSSASPFHIAISGGQAKLCPSTRRASRARIFALGGTPPPSSREPEGDKGDKQDAADAAKAGEGAEGAEEMTADDILSSPAFLKKKLEIVQKELIEAKSKLDEDSDAVKAEKEKYLRLAADYENYRRRSMDDLRKQDTKSTAKVCKSILGVLDNFERATNAVNAQTDREKVISSSYQAINKQLLDALVKLKVEPIDAVGQLFNPEFHEAIQRFESKEHAEDVVCAQFQRGYKIDETLIRAAIVGVSSGPGPEAAKDAESGNGATDSVDEPLPEGRADSMKEGKVEGQ